MTAQPWGRQTLGADNIATIVFSFDDGTETWIVSRDEAKRLTNVKMAEAYTWVRDNAKMISTTRSRS